MRGHGEKLSRLQEKAVAALLSEPTVEKAAEKAGVAPSTLARWRKLPEFREAEMAARREVVDRGITLVQLQATAAALALHRNLTCGNPAVEVRAALAVFEVGQQGAGLAELVEALHLELERLRHAHAGAGEAG